MNNSHFDKFVQTKAALLAAEKEHPDSRSLKVLHGRLSAALDSFSHLFTEEQFVALGGGVPKTEDPNG